MNTRASMEAIAIRLQKICIRDKLSQPYFHARLWHAARYARGWLLNRLGREGGPMICGSLFDSGEAGFQCDERGAISPYQGSERTGDSVWDKYYPRVSAMFGIP